MKTRVIPTVYYSCADKNLFGYAEIFACFVVEAHGIHEPWRFTPGEGCNAVQNISERKYGIEEEYISMSRFTLRRPARKGERHGRKFSRR